LRTAIVGLATGLAVGAAAFLLTARIGSAQGQTNTSTPTATEPALVAEGRALYVAGCASCHGFDAHGISGMGPSLENAGALATDFYLSTGRMPLKEEPGSQPERAEPAYEADQIRALVAYVGSLGGPSIPAVHPEEGNLRLGLQAYTSYCAGCHQIVGEGGVVTGAVPPALKEATPTQIAEAVRMGPYVMPRFDERTIDKHTLASIVRYVELTKDPVDEGGWGIGHLGPIPEGLVAWLIGLAALVLVVRFIGERSE
jgi:ubiquinol-cytochrome c reductase cytochrome c subunit